MIRSLLKLKRKKKTEFLVSCTKIILGRVNILINLDPILDKDTGTGDHRRIGVIFQFILCHESSGTLQPLDGEILATRP